MLPLGYQYRMSSSENKRRIWQQRRQSIDNVTQQAEEINAVATVFRTRRQCFLQALTNAGGLSGQTRLLYVAFDVLVITTRQVMAACPQITPSRDRAYCVSAFVATEACMSALWNGTSAGEQRDGRGTNQARTAQFCWNMCVAVVGVTRVLPRQRSGRMGCRQLRRSRRYGTTITRASGSRYVRSPPSRRSDARSARNATRTALPSRGKGRIAPCSYPGKRVLPDVGSRTACGIGRKRRQEY